MNKDLRLLQEMFSSINESPMLSQSPSRAYSKKSNRPDNILPINKHKISLRNEGNGVWVYIGANGRYVHDKDNIIDIIETAFDLAKSNENDALSASLK